MTENISEVAHNAKMTDSIAWSPSHYNQDESTRDSGICSFYGSQARRDVTCSSSDNEENTDTSDDSGGDSSEWSQCNEAHSTHR